ncbi:MAG: Glycosyltransferase [Oceanicaulis sp. HLUCCA04]|nr:MAG: Glycosyltransferase [Oceanicaulis sp. HLUCCA04]
MTAGQASADVTILIVAYDSAQHWPRLKAALAAQTVRPRRILVLENGSPSSPLSPQDVPDSIELVVSDTNLGFAGGNNRLAAKADTRWLVLLNPDAFPAPDWLEQLLAAAQRYPGASLFGSTQRADGHEGVLDGAGDVYHITGIPYRGGYGVAMASPADGEIFAPCAAAMMIRRDVFEAVGGFDEDYFCYVEDVDLGARARLAGHAAIHVRDAIVNHVGYGSSGRRSVFATWHGTRNRLWTWLKTMPLPLLILTAPLHLAMTLALWLSAARFGHFRLFGRALGDALMGLPGLWRKRRAVQSGRQVTAADYARMMAFSPVDFFTRRPLHRPVSARARRTDH